MITFFFILFLVSFFLLSFIWITTPVLFLFRPAGSSPPVLHRRFCFVRFSSRADLPCFFLADPPARLVFPLPGWPAGTVVFDFFCYDFALLNLPN
jgi:hypothetical protein